MRLRMTADQVRRTAAGTVTRSTFAHRVDNARIGREPEVIIGAKRVQRLAVGRQSRCMRRRHRAPTAQQMLLAKLRQLVLQPGKQRERMRHAGVERKASKPTV